MAYPYPTYPGSNAANYPAQPGQASIEGTGTYLTGGVSESAGSTGASMGSSSGFTGDNTYNTGTGQGYDINGQPSQFTGYTGLSGDPIYETVGGLTANEGGPLSAPFPISGNQQGGALQGPPMYVGIPEQPTQPQQPQTPLQQTLNITVPQQQQQRPSMPAPNALSQPTGSFSGMPNSPLPNVPNNSPLTAPGSSSPSSLPGVSAGNTQPGFQGSGGGMAGPSGAPMGGQQTQGNQTTVAGPSGSGGGMESSPASGQPSTSGGGPWSQPTSGGQGGISQQQNGGLRSPTLYGGVSQNVGPNGQPLPGGQPGAPPGGGAPQGGGGPGGQGQPQDNGQTPFEQAASGAVDAFGRAIGSAANWFMPPAEAAEQQGGQRQAMVPPPPPYAPAQQIIQMQHGQSLGAGLLADASANKLSQLLNGQLKTDRDNAVKNIDFAMAKNDVDMDNIHRPLIKARSEEVQSWAPDKEKGRFMTEQLANMRELLDQMHDINRREGPMANLTEEGAAGGQLPYNLPEMAKNATAAQNAQHPGRNTFNKFMHPGTDFDAKRTAINYNFLHGVRQESIQNRQAQLSELRNEYSLRKSLYDDMHAAYIADNKALADAYHDYTADKIATASSIIAKANQALMTNNGYATQADAAVGRYLQAKQAEASNQLAQEQQRLNNHNAATQDFLAQSKVNEQVATLIANDRKQQVDQANKDRDMAMKVLQLYTDGVKAGQSKSGGQQDPEEAQTNSEQALRKAMEFVKKQTAPEEEGQKATQGKLMPAGAKASVIR